MPLTAAEKMRRRREKLKNGGKYEEYKERVREAVKKSRVKKKKYVEKLPASQYEKIRSKTRKECKLRVAKHRERLCRAKLETAKVTPAYKTRNSFGKAKAKAKRALPNSPRKRKIIVTNLYQKFVAATSDTDENVTNPTSKENEYRCYSALNPETIKAVKEFYEHEELSRQAPGMKDVVIIRDAKGTKSKIQARHLLFSIHEMYQMFMEENPKCKIGKSKFFELRPKHVLLSSKLPRNVCLCQYHENFRLAIEAFSKFQQLQTFVDFESFLCFEKTQKCWNGECSECCNKLMEALDSITEQENLNDVSWYVWKKDEGKLKKLLEEGSSMDLAEHIKNIAPHFFKHVHTKREQSVSYRKQIERAVSPLFDSKIGIVQVDFAENYTCAFQDEVQSAHWQQSQVSIFTISAWYFGRQHSMALVSDNLLHSKETVIPFMDCVLEQLPKDITEVHVWSDGPSSQFKNRYVAAALNILEKKHGKHLTWNFFATSHGKGPVDGIGGSIKRSVRNAVLKRKCIVNNAKDFVHAAQEQPSKIEIRELSPAEIEIRSKNLNLAKLFLESSPIENIKLLHHFKTQEGKPVGYYLSKDPLMEENEYQIKVGEWYMVKYDNSLYPGMVTSIEHNEYKVNVMTPAKSYWKWPAIADEIFYKKENMMCKIEPPIVVNARGHYKLQKLK